MGSSWVTVGCPHSAPYRKMLSRHSSRERGSHLRACASFSPSSGHTEPKLALPTAADSAGFPAGLQSVFLEASKADLG